MRSTLQLLASTNKTAETDDFRERLVPGETADNLLVPWFLLLIEDRSAQFRQFFLDARQPCFQLFDSGCHTSYYRGWAAADKAVWHRNKQAPGRRRPTSQG
jgi:hypothetical protein